MKIDAIHIDGFGKFCRLSVGDLPPGLVILTGANEAGKSTLFTFIRRMFFGIPNTRCNLYLPLEGGQHGGRLAVTDSSGKRWVIERNASRKDEVKVVLPDGNTGGKPELLKLLGHADRNVFENIYAFGLEELQSFETLNDQSINSKLYSAGTGVGVSISELVKSISNMESNLYKPKGRKPLINELLREIRKTEEKIAEFEGAQKKYDSLHFELEQRNLEIDQLKEKSQNIRKKLNRIQNLLAVWDDWRNLQELKTALGALPGLESFPEKGEEKLERLLEKIEEIRENISKLEQELEKNAVNVRSLSPDESLQGQKDAVLELENGLEKYRSEVKTLPLLEANLKQEKDGFSELLLELGPTWNEEVLDRFDRSIPSKENVIKMRKAVEEIEAKIKETENELKQILNSIERIQQENSVFEERLLAHRDKVIELGNGIEKYRADKDFLLSGTQELQAKKDRLSELLLELGPTWNEEALGRFDRSIPAKENIIQMRRSVEKIEDKIKETENELKQILNSIERIQQENSVFEERLLAHRDKVIELGNGIEKYRADKDFLLSGTKELQERKAEMGKTISELGKGWDESTLASFEYSVPSKENVVRKQREIEEAEKKIENLHDKLGFTFEEIKEINGEIEALEEELRAFSKLPGPDEIKQGLEAVSYLRVKYTVLREKEGELKNLEKEEMFFAAFRSQEAREEGLPLWPAGMIFFAGCLGFAFEYMNNALIPGIIIFFLLFATSAAYFQKARKRSASSPAEQEQYQDTESRKQKVQDLKEQLSGEIDALKRDMKKLAEKCGFEDIPDPSVREQKASELQRAMVELQSAGELGQRKEKLQKKLGKFSVTYKELESKLRDEEAGKKKVIKEWNEWLVSTGLDPGLPPENVLELFSAIRTCMEKQKAVVELEKQVKIKEVAIKNYEKEAFRILEACERTISGTALEGEIAKLREDVSFAYNQAERMKKLEVESKDLNRKKEELETSLREEKRARDSLSEKWVLWLESYGLDPTLSMESVLELFSAIRTCIEKQKAIVELEKQVKIKEVAIKNYEKEVVGVLEACGRTVSGTALEGEIAKLREDVSFAYNQAERMRTLEIESRDLESKKEEIEALLLEEKKERDALSKKWTCWLEAYGLDTSLSVESVLEIFSVIRTCFDRQRTVRNLEEQIASGKTSIEAYEAKVSGVLQECRRPFSGLSFDTQVEKLRSDFEQASEEARSLHQLKTRSKELEIELQAAQDKYEDAAKELAFLLESGSAETEEEFRENTRLWAQRTGLENRVSEAEQQIRRISGDGEKYKLFVEELQASDPLGLEEENRRLEECLETLEQETTENMDRRGAIGNQIEQLEHGSEGSLARVMQESLLEGLHEKSREWASLVLARKVLAKAIEVYEKERQPAVIVEAQAFFSKITGGRYTRIYSPLNSSEIYVEDREGHHKSVSELSRGTAEQLYLSLRFGFIREFGRHSESLPVVFDDVLVNFDPERCKSTCEAIKDLVSGNQVFYFTCHPETVQMLVERFPEARAVDLEKVA